MSTTVPVDVWAGWVERACQINEYAPPVRDRGPAPPAGGRPSGEDSPGTDFNRRGSWTEAGLFDAGWAWERQADADRGLVRRPDKDRGVSASVGMVTSKENGWPLFYCWSTSVPEFIAEQTYTRFAVFAELRHGGDFQAAARDLAARGYGRRMPAVGEVTVGPAVMLDNGPAPDDRLFRWMSELRVRPENDKWLWHGFLSRGGVTLLNALWKAGKSTLLAHLLRAFDGRAAEFLGRPITSARVLYVSEEHEDLWAGRRDDLGIGDHVGIITRDMLPFRGRASPADWAAFIGRLVAEVQKYRFDVVVLDTLSKLWPVREENDAGQVEDALMPLWNVTNLGAALLLVHHNRKSDGKDFTGSRGSGGLPAFCETIIEFRRNSENQKDDKRVLTSGGRYRETPPKLLIQLKPDGYVSHGDPDEMTPAQKVEAGITSTVGDDAWKAVALQILPISPPGMTREELLEKLKDKLGEAGREEAVRNWLNHNDDHGEGDKFLFRSGKGKAGSPFRWHRVDVVPPESSPTPWDACGDESGRRPDADENISQSRLPMSSPEVSQGVGDDPPGYDPRSRPEDPVWWPELLMMIRANGPMTADQLNELSGFPIDEIKSGLEEYVAARLLTVADKSGIYSLPVVRPAMAVETTEGSDDGDE